MGRALVLIRGVRAIDPSANLDATVDVVIEDGKLARVGPGAITQALLKAEGAMIVEGAGLWAVPGLVDVHTHLREPGHEYKEDIASGLRAAAAGGFVRVCAMPNTKPVNDTRAITEAMVARAKSASAVRMHPIGAITKNLEGVALTEMADLRDAGAVAVSDDGRCVTNSAVMRRALEYARTFDLPVIQHAEDHALTEGAQMHEGAVSTRLGLQGWPRVAEDIIVGRDLALVGLTRARYHVAHISTRGALALVREAKSRGLPVTAEVTPHHLWLTDEAVLGYNTACKVAPPLREAHDIEALREGLADGTIDCIATDHAPHSVLEKDCEFALASPGMVGLELVVPLLLELVAAGALPLARMLDALTLAPSRLIATEPPTLREGAEANLCLIAPTERWTIGKDTLRSKSHNTPFLGREVTGRVRATWAAGELSFQAS